MTLVQYKGLGCNIIILRFTLFKIIIHGCSVIDRNDESSCMILHYWKIYYDEWKTFRMHSRELMCHDTTF